MLCFLVDSYNYQDKFYHFVQFFIFLSTFLKEKHNFLDLIYLELWLTVSIICQKHYIASLADVFPFHNLLTTEFNLKGLVNTNIVDVEVRDLSKD